jgi:sialate O-acetylesterase
MRPSLLPTLGLILVSLLSAPLMRAEVSLPSLLSDHMILQRSSATAVWGKAAAGEKIKVTLGDLRAETTADADGRWKTTLNLSAANEGPFDMIVEGTNRITVADVLVGEVWLCSGQSNMAYTLDRSTGASADIASSANPRLRQFRVDTRGANEPLENCKGHWVLSDPQTSAQFSAVGYYFAQDLQKTLNAPVGIVLSAWAGTVATAWISQDTLNADPELKSILDRGLEHERDYPGQKAAYPAAMAAWQSLYERADRPSDADAYAAVKLAEQDWKTVELPAKLKDLGLPDAGAVWFRKHVTLPAAPHAAVTIDIGGPHDFDAVYWNGQKIGEMTVENASGRVDSKRYPIPADQCKEGDNVIALRVFTPTEKSGFSWQPFVDIGTNRSLIATGWLAKTEFALPELTKEARKDLPQIPSAPDSRSVGGRLYNGMIAPLVPVSLAGVVWYQGEQDTGRPTALYRKMLSGLIIDWRAKWGSKLPFLVCQLPNYGAKISDSRESRWADIREAQLETVSTLPATAQTVLIDLGDENVHPPSKKPVGERVALTALGAFYKKTADYSGPVFQSLKADGDKLVLTFAHADRGLVAKPLPARYQPTALAPAIKDLILPSPASQLQGFAVCGPDKKWSWAEARIVGSTVIVSSPAVPQPVAVRYAWADNPTCNLYGADGLPASPFVASVR